MSRIAPKVVTSGLATVCWRRRPSPLDNEGHQNSTDHRRDLPGLAFDTILITGCVRIFLNLLTGAGVDDATVGWLPIATA
jgi:hypothetical protein